MSFQVFTAIEEDALVDYIITCSTMFHGLGYGDVRRLSFEYAEKPARTCRLVGDITVWQVKIGCTAS